MFIYCLLKIILFNPSYLFIGNNSINNIDIYGLNRYITQFDILDLGNSGGTQLHVGVAVDTWKCDKDGKWIKTGIKQYDFSIDWDAGWFNFVKCTIWKSKGRITISDGLTLQSPVTIQSKPCQDIKMRKMLEKEAKNPPFYNALFHQCIFWSVNAIQYGMDKKCSKCCNKKSDD